MTGTVECPARYEYAGLFKTEDAWIHPVRTIDTCEIMVIVSGTVSVFEDDRQFTLNAGELILLRPGLKHGGWKMSEGTTSFYWIHFHASPEEISLLPEGPVRIEDPSHINLLCRQLLHIANAPGYPEYAVQAAFSLIFCELQGLSRRIQPGTRLVSELAEWIRINSCRPLSVAAVARQSGYHPDYLSSLFREAFHMSLKQYIAEQRMQQIRSLLLTTTDSIKEIAARLGFENGNQLMHFFRYHEGISPISYRNLYHRTHLNRS